jgi:hypothetical protein
MRRDNPGRTVSAGVRVRCKTAVALSAWTMEPVCLKLVPMGLGIALLLLAAAGTKARSGEVLLRRSCTTCHTLDSIKARRLSRKDWALEVDKMAAMGAQIQNRKALLDYLVRTYGP